MRSNHSSLDQKLSAVQTTQTQLLAAVGELKGGNRSSSATWALVIAGVAALASVLAAVAPHTSR